MIFLFQNMKMYGIGLRNLLLERMPALEALHLVDIPTTGWPTAPQMYQLFVSSTRLKVLELKGVGLRDLYIYDIERSVPELHR